MVMYEFGFKIFPISVFGSDFWGQISKLVNLYEVLSREHSQK